MFLVIETRGGKVGQITPLVYLKKNTAFVSSVATQRMRYGSGWLNSEIIIKTQTSSRGTRSIIGWK